MEPDVQPISHAYSEDQPPPSGPFYSVFIPLDLRSEEAQTAHHIYTDKTEALKTVKKTKKARFKCFELYDDALSFATLGAVEHPKVDLGHDQIACVTNCSSIGSEKPSAFKGPKPQDLVKLRKSIEGGDLAYFRKCVWDNPRYLVSSGDTPSILQEGFRYNALHIAAKAKNAVLAEYILSTISDCAFIKLLYGNDDVSNSQNVDKRIQVLLDLYLNTPDKGANETPLHFASKFGAAEVVEVLVSFPQCDKQLKNKYGQTPDKIICDRCDKNMKSLNQIRHTIALHLENCYYVPVLRAEDNSITPVIGEPFSPGGSENSLTSRDPLSPRLEIHAYAGPMSRESADNFRKIWKTPPRSSTPIKPKPGKRINNCSLDADVVSLKYKDPAKGLERVGDKLARQMDISWKEYWAFLNCFVDIASPDGLDLLENHLKRRTETAVSQFSLSQTQVEVVIGRPSGKNGPSVSDLCIQMQNCDINDSMEASDFDEFLCVEKACEVFANRISTEIYARSSDCFQVQAMLFETQTKQVELLALSYMEDARFSRVNFSTLHPRLGLLTAKKLTLSMETLADRKKHAKNMHRFIAECGRAFDCFSSDDEAAAVTHNNHNTVTSNGSSTKKQMICLMQHIVNNFESRWYGDSGGESCEEAWKRTDECCCTFHQKRGRLNKNKRLSRRSDVISRRLCFPPEQSTTVEGDDSDDLEEFFTPCATPAESSSSESESDYYSDAAPPISEVFLEGGENPSKTDASVFNALRIADDCHLDRNKYPNVYRWYHSIGMFSNEERDSWPSVSGSKSPHYVASTPKNHNFSNFTSGHVNNSSFNNNNNTFDSSMTWDNNNFMSPPRSWMRITGTNSPIASKK